MKKTKLMALAVASLLLVSSCSLNITNSESDTSSDSSTTSGIVDTTINENTSSIIDTTTEETTVVETTTPTTSEPTIEVIDVSSIEVTSLKEINLNIGSSSNITYKVLPENATNKNVSLMSSNSKIVSVNGTKIKGLKTGEATITLISVANTEITATIKVIVEAKIDQSITDRISGIDSNDNSYFVSNYSYSNNVKTYSESSETSEVEIFSNNVRLSKTTATQYGDTKSTETLLQKSGNRLYTLTKNDSVSLDAEVSEYVLTESEKDKIELPSYSYESNALTYFKTEIAKSLASEDNVKVETKLVDDNHVQIDIVSSYKEWAWDTDISGYQVSFIEIKFSGTRATKIVFNKNKYKVADFNVPSLKPNEGAVSDEKEEITYSLSYETRKVYDNSSLSLKDYLASSFDVAFTGKDGKITTEFVAGENYSLKIENLLPATSIDNIKITKSSNEDVVSLWTASKNIQPKAAGKTDLTIESQSGITKIVSIEVKGPAPESIDFEWRQKEEVFVGKTIDIEACVSSSYASQDYTIELVSGGEFGRLTLEENGTYTLLGLKAGSVVVVAKCKAPYESISKQLTITVKESVTAIGQLTGKNWVNSNSPENGVLTFNLDEGMTNSGKGSIVINTESIQQVITFNWSFDTETANNDIIKISNMKSEGAKPNWDLPSRPSTRFTDADGGYSNIIFTLAMFEENQRLSYTAEAK